jgi:integrase
MSARKDTRGRIFYRKQVKHPLTGQRVTLFSYTDDQGRPFTKKSEASAAERKAIEELKQPARGTMPTFDDWFNGRFWVEWVLGGPRGANSPGEQESKQLIYGKHLKTFFGALPLDRIDVERINTFRAHLRGMLKPDGSRLYSEKTVNNVLAVLSTPLQYAAKAGILMRAPHVGVAKVERPEIEFIEFEEVCDLVRAALEDERPELLIAVLLAFEAGLRIGEIRALEWPTVDMKARTITVVQQVRVVGQPWSEGTPPLHENGRKRGKRQYVDVLGPPKGRRRRIVPISPALYEALCDRVRAGYVVSAAGGQRITKEIVRCGMERIARRAGLGERVSGWHVGRHTFGTHAALLAVNPWDLNQWMGHTRMEETQLYADVARAHGRRIPPQLLAAGANEPDPSRRVLAQLSARLVLSSNRKKSCCKVAAKNEKALGTYSIPRASLVTPPGLEPGISA